MSSTRRPRRTLGMRARVTVLFSLAGLLLAAALALLTYSLARNQLSSQRDDGALQQAFVNASAVRDFLRNGQVGRNEVIREVRPDSGGFALVHFNSDDNWFQHSPFSEGDLPDALRRDVLAGDTGRQRFLRDGQPFLAVGVNVAEFDVQYFEVFPLAPLARSLRVVGGSLILGSAVAALLAAAVGWSASRRAAASGLPRGRRRQRAGVRASWTPAWSPSGTPTSIGW